MSKLTHLTVRRVLLAAVAAVPLAATADAFAQQRVFQGRANDANTQVGSGGINTQVQSGPAYSQNDIIYGRVTGGKYFRGDVDTFDDKAFAGGIVQRRAGVDDGDVADATRVSDNFIRDSAGVTTGGVTSFNSLNYQAEPFYSPQRYVPPPPGFERQPFVGTFVPRQQELPGQFETRTNLLPATRTDDLVPGIGGIPTPQAAIPGVPNTADDSTELVREINAAAVRNLENLTAGRPEPLSRYTTLFRRDAAGGLDVEQVVNLRRQLLLNNRDAVLAELEDQVPGRPRTGELERERPGTLLDGPGTTRLDDRTARGDRIGTADAAGERMMQLLANPALQNQTVARLQQRLETFSDPLTGVNNQLPQAPGEEQRQALRQQQAQRLNLPGQEQTNDAPGFIQPGVPGQERPGQQRPGEAQRGQPGAEPAPGVERPAVGERPQNQPEPVQRQLEPIDVRSFAEGVQLEALATVIREAEQLMNRGQYDRAIEQFQAARQVDQANPLLQVGQAVAELGAGYYRPAARNVQEAMLADDAMLVAKFDLFEMLGEQKLQQIVEDLKRLTQEEANSPVGPLLLAFVSYNTGAESRALQFLDVARERGAGRAVQKMQRFWSATIPGGDELNK